MVKMTFKAGFIIFAVYLLYIISFGLFSKAAQSDVCVILGNKVNTDGHPSARLKARLDKAAELYKKGICKFIIVSGGRGKEGFNEADVMRQYLINKCISPIDIIPDSSGINSFKTALFVKNFCARNGLHSVIGISQYFDLLRVKISLKKSGIEKISVEAPVYFEIRDLFSIFREAVGIPVYLVR